MSKFHGKIQCPTCGRHAVAGVIRDISVKVGAKTVKVHGVSIEECEHCGERLYGLAALDRIRQERKKAIHKHAA